MNTLPWPRKPNTDLFGVPLAVGDTVLTNRYGSASLGLVTKIVKQTKSFSYVEAECNRWNPSTKQYEQITKRIRKYSYQLIRIQPLLDYNIETYPELLV